MDTILVSRPVMEFLKVPFLQKCYFAKKENSQAADGSIPTILSSDYFVAKNWY